MSRHQTPARPAARAPRAAVSPVTVTCVAGALAASLAARPLAAQQGVTFTYRVQSTAAARGAREGGGREGAPSPNMLATVRMAGGNVRMDIREGSMPMTGNGGYILIRGAQQQLVLVNAKDKQAMVIGADGLGAGFGALTNNALVKMSFRDQRFAFEELGAGERILGMPTRRVRTTSGGTMEVRVLGRTNRTTDSTTTEMWIAPRPAGLDASALEGWSKSFGRGVGRTNPELARQMADYNRKYGDGLVLRTVAVSRSDDGKGKQMLDTMRMEVTELSRASIPPSTFDIPSDYQVVDTREMARGIDSARRANGDTGSVGDAMKQGMKEGAKEGAAEKAREALGGLFRRRRP